MTEVHGRTFGVWTLLTCTLCYLCAFNLDNKPLYQATFLSFIYAFGHFLTEYLIYDTMAISNLITVGIFAGMSISLLVCNQTEMHYVMLLFLCSPKVNILPRIKENLMRNTCFLLYAFVLTIILDKLWNQAHFLVLRLFTHEWILPDSLFYFVFYLLIFILGTSIIWMGLQWNRHQIVRVKHS